ncbi:hypothetical protein WG909_10330 [Peptostreptococcaceae bacterium AGR-M142]
MKHKDMRTIKTIKKTITSNYKYEDKLSKHILNKYNFEHKYIYRRLALDFLKNDDSNSLSLFNKTINKNVNMNLKFLNSLLSKNTKILYNKGNKIFYDKNNIQNIIKNNLNIYKKFVSKDYKRISNYILSLKDSYRYNLNNTYNKKNLNKLSKEIRKDFYKDIIKKNYINNKYNQNVLKNIYNKNLVNKLESKFDLTNKNKNYLKNFFKNIIYKEITNKNIRYEDKNNQNNIIKNIFKTKNETKKIISNILKDNLNKDIFKKEIKQKKLDIKYIDIKNTYEDFKNIIEKTLKKSIILKENNLKIDSNIFYSNFLTEIKKDFYSQDILTNYYQELKDNIELNEEGKEGIIAKAHLKKDVIKKFKNSFEDKKLIFKTLENKMNLNKEESILFENIKNLVYLFEDEKIKNLFNTNINNKSIYDQTNINEISKELFNKEDFNTKLEVLKSKIITDLNVFEFEKIINLNNKIKTFDLNKFYKNIDFIENDKDEFVNNLFKSIYQRQNKNIYKKFLAQNKNIIKDTLFKDISKSYLFEENIINKENIYYKNTKQEDKNTKNENMYFYMNNLKNILKKYFDSNSKIENMNVDNLINRKSIFYLTNSNLNSLSKKSFKKNKNTFLNIAKIKDMTNNNIENYDNSFNGNLDFVDENLSILNNYNKVDNKLSNDLINTIYHSKNLNNVNNNLVINDLILKNKKLKDEKYKSNENKRILNEFFYENLYESKFKEIFFRKYLNESNINSIEENYKTNNANKIYKINRFLNEDDYYLKKNFSKHFLNENVFQERVFTKIFNQRKFKNLVNEHLNKIIKNQKKNNEIKIINRINTYKKISNKIELYKKQYKDILNLNKDNVELKEFGKNSYFNKYFNKQNNNSTNKDFFNLENKYEQNNKDIQILKKEENNFISNFTNTLKNIRITKKLNENKFNLMAKNLSDKLQIGLISKKEINNIDNSKKFYKKAFIEIYEDKNFNYYKKNNNNIYKKENTVNNLPIGKIMKKEQENINVNIKKTVEEEIKKNISSKSYINKISKVLYKDLSNSIKKEMQRKGR